MPIALRAATAADLPAITRVFLACWRESYRGVLPAETIAAMNEERARELWQRVLNSAEGELLVAERFVAAAVAAGPPHGAELLGLSRFAITAPRVGGVYSLYVSPTAQGLGLGSRLLGAASERLAELGANEASLWVFANNAPSIAFYRKNGWLPDGGERIQDEFGQPELRLSTTLGGTPRRAREVIA